MTQDTILAALSRAELWKADVEQTPCRVNVSTNRGRLRTDLVDEYLQDNIPCGVTDCDLCPPTYSLSAHGSLWIIDLPLLVYGHDFLWDDPVVNNCVILESHLDFLKYRDLRAFIKLLKLCRVERTVRRKGIFRVEGWLDCQEELPDDRRFYVYPDNVSVGTHLAVQDGDIPEEVDICRLTKVTHWYTKHLPDTEVCILSSTPNRVRKILTIDSSVNLITIQQLLSKKLHLYPQSGSKLGDITKELLYDDKGSTEDSKGETFYPPYIGQSALARMVHDGKAFKGTIKMYSNTCFRATLKPRNSTNHQEIHIVGAVNINRSIHGDQVVVELLDETMTDNIQAVLQAQMYLDSSPEEVYLRDSEDEIHASLPSGILYGRVVALIRRTVKTFCGTPRLHNKVTLDDDLREIAPVSPSIPITLLKSRHLETLENHRLVFVIDDWKRTSLLPEGHWIDDLGIAGEINTECKVILREYGIITRPFSDAAQRCLPKENYAISDEEATKRIDLRLKYCPCDECRYIRNKDSIARTDQELELWGTPCLYTIKTDLPRPLQHYGVETDPEFKKIACERAKNPQWEEYTLDENLQGVWTCSIDPITCVDIDDALSLKFLPNGNFEVGVHIADVTHFVKSDQALDREAAIRCTTVYLVNQRTDMLPKVLSANLCSLRAGKDRLCFSVFWEMTPKAKIKRMKFYKTVIHSTAAFSYQQAQTIIDDIKNTSPIAVRLRTLNQLAKDLRRRRIARGSVELASAEVQFQFAKQRDPVTGHLVDKNDPSSISAYEHYETHNLIEEFMLLANTSVANKIVSAFPDCSVLRRHPPPKGAALEELGRKLRELGFKFEYGTSKQLAKSLDRCQLPNNQLFNKLVRQITVQCMNRAVYFCTAEITDPTARSHYALATDLYTHFTSPIRRYADIMVHRLLAAAIDWESLSLTMSNSAMTIEQCEKMTMKHMSAQYCQRASADYFSYRLFSTLGSAITVDAIVIQIRRNGCSVTCPAMAINGIANFNEEEFEYVEGGRLIIRQSQDCIQIFDHVKVLVISSDTDYRFRISYKLVRKCSPQEVAQSAELAKKIIITSQEAE